ncbi:MAG: YneF family protein [Lysinibacillus sp.]|nr:YneF family protein [Lysinibacillus sp.]
MQIWLAILLIVVALIAGVALGFFMARQYMMKYLKENPPINEQMIRVMMAQMGRKPSEKQVRQMMAQLNKIQEKTK